MLEASVSAPEVLAALGMTESALTLLTESERRKLIDSIRKRLR